MQRTAIAALAGLFVSAMVSPVVADDTGLAYAHTLRKEQGKMCMADHWHSGSGDGRSKAAAQKAAVRSWAGFTNFEYGTVWARYSLAASKKTRYVKAADGWTAYVDARPCRR